MVRLVQEQQIEFRYPFWIGDKEVNSNSSFLSPVGAIDGEHFLDRSRGTWLTAISKFFFESDLSSITS